MENPNQSKKIIISILSVVIGVVIFFIVKQLLIKPEATFDDALLQAANEINKSCPIMVDAETQLDNTVALPGKIFQYNYTLVNFVKDSIDVESIKAILEPNILNNVKTNPDLANFRENDVTMNYIYKDKDGVHLLKITILPEQYK